MKKKKFDFSGYATRNDIKCSDGRIIHRDAFKDNDGESVPLVWQHLHNDTGNILGHAVLENREDGVYAYGKFNDTEAGRNAKELVEHGDITALSIYANKLLQKGSSVLHGAIREVSLVLSGANPGALIDNLSIEHSDGSYNTDESEAIIYTDSTLSLSHEEKEEKKDDSKDLKHEEKEMPKDKTIKDVFDAFTEEQKNVVYYMIGLALEGEEAEHSEGGDYMKANVFDYEDDYGQETLSHSQIEEIIGDAKKLGSLKESFLMHAQEYGIENIDYLFPDARNLDNTPDFIKRETDWVAGVIGGTRHSPFSRIKTTHADITADEARAKGYVTGALKKEEVIKLLKRVTIPTTVYKKQKLDRDDMIDITDLDVVAWLKSEMRMMLDEELARAVLVGDGRDAADEDKINEENIRPIYKENPMYAHRISVPADADNAAMVEAIIRSRKFYKGSGNPVFYTHTDVLTDMLLMKDGMGRRLYSTEAELASALRVSKIIEVPVMEGLTNTEEAVTSDLIGIIVNLKDYNMGADKGGAISMFDDFDIDYNQYKYLIETRCSGALTKPKSAIVIEKVQASAFQ